MTEKRYLGSVLNEKAILERLFIDRDLVVSPILDIGEQLGAASLDIRLGRRFQSHRTTSLLQIDPLGEEQQIELDMLKTIEQHAIALHEPYILHPGDFALASTFEFIKVPGDLAVSLEGRSSWARKGLQVHATAGFIDPGFQGLVTFELSNVSTLPIALYPAVRIGQLTFHSIADKTSLLYGQKRLSKYQGDLAPSWTLVHEDPEWATIKKLQDIETKRRS